MKVKFLRVDRLFYFISISKFGTFKNPFEMILSELGIIQERFIVSIKEKTNFFYGLP